MSDQQNQGALARAKADVTEFDRKINMIRAEETRLEQQRRQMESERDRISAFIEMYERYTGRGDGIPYSPPTALRLSATWRRTAKIERKPDDTPRCLR